MKTSASLFTGGGGFDVGAKQAGYKPVWGIEIDPKIAEYAERNINNFRVIVSDVSTVDYSILPRVDHLHLSPVCKNASVANSQGGEAPEDIEAAKASCRAIEALQPETVTLENVWTYRDFEAFHLIIRCLIENGYRLNWWHLNAADYGVPQTRKRLILIADKRRQPQRPRPTHSKTPDMFGVFAPWGGWYKATRNEQEISEPTPWQITHLGASPLRLNGNIVAIETQNGIRKATFRGAEAPLWTLTASFLTSMKSHHLISNHGQWFRFTKRAFAKIQTFPDWYELPEKNSIYADVIGNAVPCLLAQRIMESIND